MKKLKKILTLTLILALSFTVTACGGSATDSIGNTLAPETDYLGNSADYEYSAGVSDNKYYDSMEKVEVANPDGEIVNPALSNRKIIYTADIYLESTEYDNTVSLLEQAIKDNNGYISHRNTYGSEYSGGRSTNFTVRIPAENYNNFMNSAGSAGNLVRKNESSNDITAKYVDTEARIEVMKAEKARLEELMKKADTMEDIIKLDERISSVQADIEGYTAQLRTMNDQVQMCTIDVDVQEVIIYTPTDTRFSTEFITAFKSGWKTFVEVIQGIILAVAYNSFFIVFFGPILVFGIKFYKKREKKQRKDLTQEYKEFFENDDKD